MDRTLRRATWLAVTLLSLLASIGELTTATAAAPDSLVVASPRPFRRAMGSRVDRRGVEREEPGLPASQPAGSMSSQRAHEIMSGVLALSGAAAQPVEEEEVTCADGEKRRQSPELNHRMDAGVFRQWFPYLWAYLLKYGKDIIVFDTETTGSRAYKDVLVQYSDFKVHLNDDHESVNVSITNRYFYPNRNSTHYAYKAHGLSREFLTRFPETASSYAAQYLFERTRGTLMMSWNIGFDYRVMKEFFHVALREHRAALSGDGGDDEPVEWKVHTQCLLAAKKRIAKRLRSVRTRRHRNLRAAEQQWRSPAAKARAVSEMSAAAIAAKVAENAEKARRRRERAAQRAAEREAQEAQRLAAADELSAEQMHALDQQVAREDAAERNGRLDEIVLNVNHGDDDDADANGNLAGFVVDDTDEVVDEGVARVLQAIHQMHHEAGAQKVSYSLGKVVERLMEQRGMTLDDAANVLTGGDLGTALDDLEIRQARRRAHDAVYDVFMLALAIFEMAPSAHTAEAAAQVAETWRAEHQEQAAHAAAAAGAAAGTATSGRGDVVSMDADDPDEIEPVERAVLSPQKRQRRKRGAHVANADAGPSSRASRSPRSAQIRSRVALAPDPYRVQDTAGGTRAAKRAKRGHGVGRSKDGRFKSTRAKGVAKGTSTRRATLAPAPTSGTEGGKARSKKAWSKKAWSKKAWRPPFVRLDFGSYSDG